MRPVRICRSRNGIRDGTCPPAQGLFRVSRHLSTSSKVQSYRSYRSFAAIRSNRSIWVSVTRVAPIQSRTPPIVWSCQGGCSDARSPIALWIAHPQRPDLGRRCVTFSPATYVTFTPAADTTVRLYAAWGVGVLPAAVFGMLSTEGVAPFRRRPKDPTDRPTNRADVTASVIARRPNV